MNEKEYLEIRAISTKYMIDILTDKSGKVTNDEIFQLLVTIANNQVVIMSIIKNHI